MSGVDRKQQFAEVYNDIAKYPTLRDVAKALGKSKQTVKNFAGILRRQRKKDTSVPALIDRAPLKELARKVAPAEHAENRATAIRSEMRSLVESTHYPVLNPEAIVTERRMSRRYDRVLGEYVEIEGGPRTWLTDTLRVAGRENAAGRRYIFTGAQNDAEIHEGFWENLEAYALEAGAEIVVGPWTYETNWWDENSPTARNYDYRITPHLCFGQMQLGRHFVFCGEMNTLPTTPRPVSDLTSYGRGRWAVYPHARLQLLSVPSTNPGEQAHHVMTTGAVTRPKVIPRKAGIKAIFNHVIGATIVEFDSAGRPFARQIQADEDGSFYDLTSFVRNGLVSHGHRVRAITFADLHIAKLGSRNALASFGIDLQGRQAPGSLLSVLAPEHVFLEDIHDNEKGSHHREHDVQHHFEMAQRGRDSVRDEVRKAMRFLQTLTSPRRQVHVVESNHDVHLERYVREGRYREDGGHNLEFGLELDLAYTRYRKEAARCLEAGEPTPKFSLLEWALRKEAQSSPSGALGDVHWIYDGNDSFVLDGIEVGHHGHRGVNGAHGSAAGFARLGRYMSIGDKHSPQILDGVFVAGAMELHHGYNRGPSGWSITHIVQYPNGKRTLITLQDGRWRP